MRCLVCLQQIVRTSLPATLRANVVVFNLTPNCKTRPAGVLDMSTSIVIVAGREPLHRVMVPQSVAVQCVAAARQLGEFQTSCGEDSGDVSLSDDDDDDENISNKVAQPTSGGGGGGGGVSACSSVELVVDAGKAITDLAIGFLLHHYDTPYNSPVFPLKSIPGAVFGDEFDNVSIAPSCVGPYCIGPSCIPLLARQTVAHLLHPLGLNWMSFCLR